MNTIIKKLFPKYYASLAIANYIVFISLEWYLFKIQPYINYSYWIPSCYSPCDSKLKHKILDLLVFKLLNVFNKNNIKISSKSHEWHSSLILQISIHIFNQLIHYYDINYPNNFEFYKDKRYKINYYSPIYHMTDNPFTNPITGGVFDYQEFWDTMIYFRENFLEMHNNIEPSNSIISLKTLNPDEQYILQEKLIFLLITIINRTDFEHIVKIIEEKTSKERIKPMISNKCSYKIIPIRC